MVPRLTPSGLEVNSEMLRGAQGDNKVEGIRICQLRNVSRNFVGLFVRLRKPAHSGRRCKTRITAACSLKRRLLQRP